MFPPLSPLPGPDGTRFRVVASRPPRLVVGGVEHAAEDRGEYWEVFVGGVGAGQVYHWTVDGRPLLDPYALEVRGHRGVVVAPPDPLNWKRPPTTLEDSVIYELHVRGYTKTTGGGTYLDLIKKIPYLNDLGVTAVELLPVHQFRSLELGRTNFWGYSPMAWFAPHAAYARRDAIAEFRAMVQAFHAAGIQVLIDVVFNHSAELGRDGPTLHLRALAGKRYYTGTDRTGCGNTLNAKDPAVKSLVLDALRWWRHGLGVDGFRFDLASVLSADPELIRAIEEDEALSGAHLIAEAWDVAGTYEVADWPGGPRWAVWNDRFRDDVRHAWVEGGRPEAARTLATRLCGSQDLFDGFAPQRGVNYIACHDGLTLADLGIHRKNLMASLLLAQGVPMLLGGDEFGRTQGGNANAYDQDNLASWVDWKGLERDAGFHAFVRDLLALRRATPQLRRATFLEDEDVRWFGAGGGPVDWDAGLFGLELPGALLLFVNLTGSPIDPSPMIPEGWEIKVDTGAPGILAACPPSHPSSPPRTSGTSPSTPGPTTTS